jgi:endo-1,4-beta-D-glucanase Y
LRRSGLGWIIAGGFAVLAAVVVIALWATGVFRSAPDPVPPTDGSGPVTEPTVSPQDSANAFLEDWVDDDGRVVRRDQGDDTVSEGQAYGLLIAVGTGDEEKFESIWSWTEDNIMREDGLLAWRWQDGAVVDDEPASDADLDAARALVLAGDRFGRQDFTDAGTGLAAQILDGMTATTPLGRIMLPGLWAAGGPDYFYNPSYASPAAFAVLGEATGDIRWAELEAGGAAVTAALHVRSPLPPDWAQVTADGTVNAMPGAGGLGEDVRYSYDAARLPLRFAESCRPEDRTLAAQLLPPLNRQARLPTALDLGGTELDPDQHPVGYLARAAAASAAGDVELARQDIDRASALGQEFGTYYGAAWTAIGRLMLETDSLGGCATMSGEEE